MRKSTIPKNEKEKRATLANAIRSVRLYCSGRACFATCLARLARISLVFMPLYLNALDVVWIDSNTVQISGVGNEWNENTTVVTNYIGTCTNCVAISRFDLDRLCDSIDTSIDGIRSQIANINYLIQDCRFQINDEQADISKFDKFFGTTSAQIQEELVNLQPSTQKTLTTAFLNNELSGSTSIVNLRRLVAYNNGIYDYATQRINPALSNYDISLSSISASVSVVSNHVDTIENVNVQLKAVPICSNEPQFVAPTNGHSGCSWTVEQCSTVVSVLSDMKTLLGDQFKTIIAISNHVASIDSSFASYAEFIKNALFQSGGTIRLSDGEDWETVYNLEHADGYDYNHSNILQRIELILYGLTRTNSTDTISGDADPVDGAETAISDIQYASDSANQQIVNKFSSAEDTFRSINEKWRQIMLRFSGLNQQSSGTAFRLFSFERNNSNDNWLDDVYLSSDDMDTISRARAFTRPAFTIVYWFAAAVIVWTFYTRVFTYIWKAIQWILEYTSSLFDS